MFTSTLLCLGLYIVGTTAILGKSLHLNFNHYYKIPLTLSELLEDKDYVLMVTDATLRVKFYCLRDDPRVAIGYDTHGNIAGIMVSFIVADLSKTAAEKNLPYPDPYPSIGLFGDAKFLNVLVYNSTVLFVDPTTLKNGGRPGKVSEVGDNVYVMLNTDGWGYHYTALPKTMELAPGKGFTEEACYNGMGKHYMYRTSTEADCRFLELVATLYDKGELIGLSVKGFGSQGQGSLRRWLESPSAELVQLVYPNKTPKCLGEWTSKFGMSALHIFFNADPGSFRCPS